MQVYLGILDVSHDLLFPDGNVNVTEFLLLVHIKYGLSRAFHGAHRIGLWYLLTRPGISSVLDRYQSQNVYI